MSSVSVRLYFNDGTHTYTFPHVQSISDPIEGIKATIIEGNRSSGAIIIPSGKKSFEITIRGLIFDNDGFNDIMTEIATMRTAVTTSVATLSLQHLVGAVWTTDWVYTGRRINPIEFGDSLRINSQEYTMTFFVTNF